MNGIVLKLILVFGIFIIIYIIMELKADNFISWKFNMIWLLLMITSTQSVSVYNNIFTEGYYLLIMPLSLIVIIGGFIIFQKNKIYLFRAIDKKLIAEKRDDIIKIIDNYKNNYIDDKPEITLLKDKVVFEGMNKTQVEECLLLIGNFLNENRKNYTMADYAIYIVKSWLVPFIIAIAAVFIVIKLILNSY
ncbi:hypothetical protein [Sedimentibacter sp.]|uniref:hypothetical protein n=1 Tax=Sedimentibacter sp. TaxID=1960295 RepID=UPI0028ABE05E|nr:hypothetical protein [Sedimentibacter sp.]